jgi:hypothetical protein
MLARLLLTILLLSSHAAVLRGAVLTGAPDVVISDDACCPLCMPADDGQLPLGCWCGCGEAQDDNRLPDAPHDEATLVSREAGLPAPERAPMRFGTVEIVHATQSAGVHDDAAGHTDTLRFLACVGQWLN